MQNELPYVPDDWQALRWAFGCLVAALGERIRAMQILDNAVVRLAIVCLIAFKVIDDLFATVLTLAYRMSALGAAERLGRLTPGDDYSRLIPLMDAVPFWLHGLLVGLVFPFVLPLMLAAALWMAGRKPPPLAQQ